MAPSWIVIARVRVLSETENRFELDMIRYLDPGLER